MQVAAEVVADHEPPPLGEEHEARRGANSRDVVGESEEVTVGKLQGEGLEARVRGKAFEAPLLLSE